MSCQEYVQCRVGSVCNVMSGVCTMSCQECVQCHVRGVYNVMVMSGVCTMSCRECVQCHVGSVYNVMSGVCTMFTTHLIGAQWSLIV